ncbi:hypothetical protein JD844_026436 [Phrynosoma platyrhinos]|uniref:DUF4758 domain-containing protein n=1 Tax=Phrynosoma platyrhinos TaxID=52577 RepID=A0ABQ7SEV3_PHRPL|nr:hypothetical protein JD844_026436 [Phrynosoma platyrhinos]
MLPFSCIIIVVFLGGDNDDDDECYLYPICSPKLGVKTAYKELKAPAAPKPDPVPVQQVEPKELVKPVPIASTVVPKVSSTTNMAFNKAPRPFGAVSSPKVTSIPSPSSAFTPAHAGFSSRASPTSQATVTPPPFTASGLHANAKSNPDQRSPVLSAAKPAVNIPWQATHNTSLNSPFNENAQEVTEGQRRGFKENQVENKEQNGNPDEVPPRKHVVYTNTEFYHPPTHSNHSKKRLIEDTEDWHPRTGTTQSRSFRILAQITGTEHMKEPEPDNPKKTKYTIPQLFYYCFPEPLVTVIVLTFLQSLIQLLHNLSLLTEFRDKGVQEFHCPGSQMQIDLINGLETQHPISVATQTCEMSDVSEESVLLSPAQRELIFKNPLEALPKCAPHSPATVHILNINQQVAIVSKTASIYTRSTRIKTGSPVLSAPVSASLRADGADNKRNLPVMSTQATQTSEPLIYPVASVESTLAAQPVKPALVPQLTGRKLPLENTLGSFLSLSAFPSTSLSKMMPSQVRNSAAATVSAAVAIRARLSHQNTYRSLLDALLITPIIKPPPLESRPSRKSTSILDMQKNWRYLVAYAISSHAEMQTKKVE